jgi:molybdopterin converting factor subunit 1
MTLSVKLFARCRDLVGSDSAVVELRDSASVSELRVALAERYPRLRPIIPNCAIAVNEDFAQDDALLKETDEVALIPPVSGG